MKTGLGPREWGDTAERGVWHCLWVVIKKQRTDVNRRELEGEEARAVFVQPLCFPRSPWQCQARREGECPARQS